MVLVGLILLGVGAATAFGLTAFQDNLLYYYPPADVAAGKAPADRVFRLGGMVEEGSLKRESGLVSTALHVTCWTFIRSYLGIYHRLKIVGTENLPARPPYITL